MDKEGNQENPSLLPNSTTNTTKEESPRKPFAGGGGGGGGGGSGLGSDRLKRDEWSEGAVSSLLEAYESKWILRNRAKLKGHDWEDVARHVSSRANSTKSPKTQTQCKNKIESMKKRYRSESAAAADASSWPLYPRLDLLLRGSSAVAAATANPVAVVPPPPPQQQQLQPSHHVASSINPPLMLLEPSPPLAVARVVPPPTQATAPPPPPTPVVFGAAEQNSHGSNGVDGEAKGEGVGARSSDHVSDKNAIDTDSSTPALYSNKEGLGSKKLKTKMEKMKKRRRKEEWEISDSIRCLAEVVVRSEKARMETMRELEKMRIEAEAKRSEMELKRTEIIANTQLEIAKLFAAGGTSNKGIDSSLRIGRN